MWFHQRRSAGSRHSLRCFLAVRVVPVWFHVVPTAASASAAKPFTREARGSCVVPCGPIGAAAQEAAIPCDAALQFAWFLCGSMWFLRRQSLLPPSRSNGSPVVCTTKGLPENYYKNRKTPVVYICITYMNVYLYYRKGERQRERERERERCRAIGRRREIHCCEHGLGRFRSTTMKLRH